MEQNSNNPYNNPYNDSPYRRPVSGKLNNMETAALILGILSITTCCCLYGAYIFGSLAIIFALLSRGGRMKMSSEAKTGLLLAIIGIVLATFFFGLSIYALLKEFGSIEDVFKEAFKEYCRMMELDYEALYGEMFQ